MTSDKESQRKRRLWSDLGPRTISGLVLAAVTLVALYFGGIWFAALVGLVFAGTYREWEIMAGGRDPSLTGWIMIGAIAVSAITYVVIGTIGAVLVLGAAALLCIVSPGRARLWRVGGLIYLGLVVIAVLLLRGSGSQGIFAGMFVAISVWMTDSAAFFTGRQVGGMKLSPDISPSKTWSGALGGLAMGTLGGTIIWLFVSPSPWWIGMLLAALLSIVGQVGDLAESAIKRLFRVKDSSDIIPGHGGLMDRLDSLTLALLVLGAIGLARGGMDGVAVGILMW